MLNGQNSCKQVLELTGSISLMVNNPILKLPNQKPLAFISHLCSSTSALNLSDCLSSRQQHLCDRGLDLASFAGKVGGAMQCEQRKQANEQRKVLANMGKFGKSCANVLHKEWNFTSRHMITFHGKIGRSRAIFKAFQQKLKYKPRDIFCSDCVRSPFKKVHTHPNCQKSIQVYRHMPRYADNPK